MFVGWKTGVIKVTERSRRIFGMALIGYLIFSLVNVVASFMGVGSGWGFGGSGLLGIAISLFAVGLASYSLAVDFDTIDRAVAAGAPEKYSWLLGHGLIVSLGLALPRDAAPAGPDARLTVAPAARPTDSPVAQAVQLELQRVVDRWRQLPLDHALRALPAVRELVDRSPRSAPAPVRPSRPTWAPAW